MRDETPTSNLNNKSSENDKNGPENLSEQSTDAEDKISSKGDLETRPEPIVNTANETKTDQAVEDIVEHEGDEVLAAEDANRSKLAMMHPKNLEQKIVDTFRAWWNNTRLRYGTLAGLVVVLLVLIVLPAPRDWALSTVGFRGSANVTIVDKATGLPLKGVSVTLAGQKASTNDDGIVDLKHLRLGSQKLTIQKIAFAIIARKVRVHLGSNKLGRIALTSIGVEYNFAVTDYLSGQPVVKAEASSNGSSAFSDQKGKILLTALSSKASTLSVTISATGYNNMTVNVPVGSATVTNVSLVPAGKEVYISNASGKYGVYTSDIDGQNKKLLLPGTGNENNNISLIISPDNKEAALVSTRDNMRDADGFLLSALTLINLSTGAPLTIDHAEQIELLGWTGTKIIYEETAAGASAANSQRERIISYDYSKNSRVSLATANQFNDAVDASGIIYYAVSSTDPSAQAYFFKINPDGTNRQTLLSQEVWSIFQTTYNTFALQTPNGWYSYTLGGKQPTSSTQPANFISYRFIDNQSGTKGLWVDTRDGKGVLLVHNISTGQDTTIATQGGLTSPVRWLSDNVAIYRVSTEQETADYAVSLNGGSPKKITDVTTSFSIGNANGY